MNTKKNSVKLPHSAESKSLTTTRKINGANESASAALAAAKALPRTVALPPAFIALADGFGMVPEQLAERVIAAFTATKPTRILVTAKASSGPAVR